MTTVRLWILVALASSALLGRASADDPFKILSDDANSEERLEAVAFVDGGKRLLSLAANNGGWCRFWNPASGKVDESFRWPGVGREISRDRMTLVTSANPSIKLHDIGRRQEVGSIPYSSDDMAFSVDAKLLAVADRKENVVRIWDVDRGGVRITMNDVGENIEHLVFCAQDKLLATVNKEDTVIQFWDWAAGRSVFRMNAHPECANGIDALAVSADGKVLASAGLRLGRPSSEDGYTTIRSILGSEIKLWDVATGKLLKTLTGRTNRHIPALLFSPNGKYLITVYETSIDIWDTSTWKLVKTLEHKMDWYFRYADVSPDGKFLAAGGWEENCIIIWKIDN